MFVHVDQRLLSLKLKLLIIMNKKPSKRNVSMIVMTSILIIFACSFTVIFIKALITGHFIMIVPVLLLSVAVSATRLSMKTSTHLSTKRHKPYGYTARKRRHKWHQSLDSWPVLLTDWFNHYLSCASKYKKFSKVPDRNRERYFSNVYTNTLEKWCSLVR